MHIRGYVGFVLATVAVAAPASAQKAITKMEVRQQDPSITDTQLRDQLWGLFRKEDRRGVQRPVRPFDSDRFVTRSYPVAAFDTYGLCRRDVVVMSLAPVRASKRDANAVTPMRAYGVESNAHFRVLLLAPGERGDAFEDMWKGPCSRIAEKDPEFFRAENETVATEGYKLLMRAAAMVKAGGLSPRCDGGPCSEALTVFAASPFSEIKDCTAEQKATCYKFVNDDDVEVKIWYSAGGPLAAEINYLIVLRHPRPD
jgi:hypothetical protein